MTRLYDLFCWALFALVSPLWLTAVALCFLGLCVEEWVTPHRPRLS